MPTEPIPPGMQPGMKSVPRAVSRRLTTARVVRLGEEPGDDLSMLLTPADRFELVATLSRRMWELTGRPFPNYTRAEMPGRVIRRP